MDYMIGDKVRVMSNAITIGVGVVESVSELITGQQAYRVRLDTPITHVDCLSDDLDIDLSDGED